MTQIIKSLALVAVVALGGLACTEETPKIMHCDAIDALSKCYEYSSTSAWAETSLCGDSRGVQREGPCPSAQIVGRCLEKDVAPPEGSLADTWVADVVMKHTAMVPAYYSRGAYPYNKQKASKDCDGDRGVLR